MNGKFAAEWKLIKQIRRIHPEKFGDTRQRETA
jgi:hypothetical protein